MKKITQQHGFTLIELLVVMAIIGILAGLISVNFISVRQRARDADRKSDIRQIQTGLELYRSDQGVYPTAGSGNVVGTCGTALTVGSTTYIQKIPCDPVTSGGYNSANYFYTASGSTYTLAACMENGNDTDPNITGTSPGGSGCSSAKYFLVTNP